MGQAGSLLFEDMTPFSILKSLYYRIYIQGCTIRLKGTKGKENSQRMVLAKEGKDG
jgi:hypothetical protein